MKHARARGAACFCVFAVVVAPLLAFGNLSAKEVRTLFSGQTVEGEFREGGMKYVEPNMVSTFSEPFVMYFSTDGAVRGIRNGKKKAGKWRVDGEGNHCVQWDGNREGCAPITREGRAYKKYMRKRGARIKWVETFTVFTPGNPGKL